MKTINTFMAMLLCACTAHAQSLFYQFDVNSDVYYEVIGGTVVTDTFTENAYNIGAPGFRAFDLPLGDVFVVGKNGFVVNTNGDVSRSFAFDPLLTGLRKHATLPSELRVLIYLPPQTNDSILIIEWENMGLENMPDDDYVNFQVWLHRPSQTVEFRYGLSQISSDSLLATLGGVTADVALLSANFTESYEQQWIKGNPLAPQIGTNPALPETLNAVPPVGTVYRFTKAVTSTQHISTKSFSVFPNPCNEFIVVESTQAILPIKFSIYDATGRLVIRGETTSTHIGTQQLQAGFYTIELKQRNITERIRFIKN